jgi:hypothetical protein
VAAVVAAADGAVGGAAGAGAAKNPRKPEIARICPRRPVTMRAWASVGYAMRSCLCVVALLATACGGSGSLSIHDELLAKDALSECRGSADLAANLQIVADLRDSYHEMIVCGGLQLDFSNALVNVIANAAIGRGGPSQLAYRGNGLFATANGMMAIQLALADGGPLGFDPLDPQSYLAGIQVTARADGMMDAAMRGGSMWNVIGHAAGSLDITFSAAGPGFQLLGMTLDEARRGHLDLTKIAKSIESHFTIANKIDVTNDQGGTRIHYILEGAPVPLTEVHDGSKIPMTLTSIVAERPGTGQVIKVTEWTMAFKGDGGKVLDGTIGMDIDGGTFPYHVKMSYPHRMEPDIALSCR